MTLDEMKKHWIQGGKIGVAPLDGRHELSMC